MLQASSWRTAPSSTPSYDPHASSLVLGLPGSAHETRVGAPRLIQSRTSVGWNLLPLTPNRCETSNPRRYARRTVSSWQPTNSATSNAVIRRLGNPLASVGPSAANCALVAVSTGSGSASFLMAPPPSSGAD